MKNSALQLLIKYLLISCTLTIGGCIRGNNPQNSGSETTSGVEIVSEKGTIKIIVKGGADIIICDTNYLSFSKEGFMIDTSTTQDTIIIRDLPEGIYNVFVYNKEYAKGSILFNVPVFIERRDNNFVYRHSTNFSELYTVKGTVLTAGKPDSSAYVFIEGTPFYSETDSAGKFVIDGIPAGRYNLKSISKLGEDRKATEYTLTIEPNRGIKRNTIEIIVGD